MICYRWQNDKMVFYECEIKKDTPVKIVNEIKKEKLYRDFKGIYFPFFLFENYFILIREIEKK